jgi:hypothetical protein
VYHPGKLWQTLGSREKNDLLRASHICSPLVKRTTSARPLRETAFCVTPGGEPRGKAKGIVSRRLRSVRRRISTYARWHGSKIIHVARLHPDQHIHVVVGPVLAWQAPPYTYMYATTNFVVVWWPSTPTAEDTDVYTRNPCLQGPKNQRLSGRISRFTAPSLVRQ